MLIIILECSLVVICVFLFLNYLYKQSAAYYNEFFDITELIKNPEPNNKMIFGGSTYSKFAFGAYKKLKLDMVDFAIQSQCLEMDYCILKKKTGKCKSGTVVFIVLAACCMMYEDGKDRIIYHKLFKDERKGMHFVKQNLELMFPLLFHPKNVKKLLNNNFYYETIYDSFPISISKKQSDIIMSNMVDGWKNMFGLSDLKSVDIPQKCEENIEHNRVWLDKIIELCLHNDFVPVIVVPPFSDRMNNFFSREFTRKIIDDNIRKMVVNKEALFFNYQWDTEFQQAYSLFIDGGFRLNEKGSMIFLKRLFTDLNSHGIEISNRKYGLWRKSDV